MPNHPEGSERFGGRIVTAVTILDCKYPGAVAWGKSYPAPGRDVSKATNGSAPGYVAVGGKRT